MSKKSERREATRQAHRETRQAHLNLAAAAPQAATPVVPIPPVPPVATPEPCPVSEAQLSANRANAQLSTGPVTPQGKASVSQNRRAHGLTGNFTMLLWEDPAEYQALVDSVHSEFQPETDTELRLAASLIQHYWLKERALKLQDRLIQLCDDPTDVDARKLALFMRYQTTHERSYYKAQRELQTIRKERRKEQIGFESQKQKAESLEARTRLAHARAESLEIDTACRQVMEVPAPGNAHLSFEELTKACSTGIATAVHHKERAAAA